jgi:hypothetical protein
MDSVEVVSSVEQLADTAKIVLPGSTHNKALDVESKVKRGDKVSIELGYNGDLQTEFTGYLQNVSTDGGSITMECEDSIFLTRKSIADKVMTDVKVKQVAEYVGQQVGGLKVECSYDFMYNKFTIHKATGFDVLKKLQDEINANIYLRGDTIHIHPAYEKIAGRTKYDFARNIESSDLKYMRAENRKYEIEVEGIMADGKRIVVTTGTPGGDKRSIKVYGVYDTEMLKKRGEEELKQLVYDGYEGSITGWLLPFVTPGYSAHIRDVDYSYKDGWYFVVAVTTSVTATGGAARKVELGKKLAS